MHGMGHWQIGALSAAKADYARRAKALRAEMFRDLVAALGTRLQTVFQLAPAIRTRGV